MDHWATGYTQTELDGAQERYQLRFPQDLIELFLERRPARGFAWETEDDRVRQMLRWPLRALLFDVEHGFWWPDFGKRPGSADERQAVVGDFLATQPRLIPILGHWFLPKTPNESGNPVFSMHGFDTIYYGADLAQYFSNEFKGRFTLGDVRHIPFCSDIIEHFDFAYAFYAASGWSKTRPRSSAPPDRV